MLKKKLRKENHFFYNEEHLRKAPSTRLTKKTVLKKEALTIAFTSFAKQIYLNKIIQSQCGFQATLR